MKEELPVPELDLTEVIRLNLNILVFFGYLRPEYNKKREKLFYSASVILNVGFLFTTYVLSEIINMIIVTGDAEKMAEGSFLFLTHFLQFFKLITYIRYKSRIWELVKTFNRKEFQPRNWKQHAILVETIQTSKRVTRFFVFMVFMTCMAWGVFPFLDKNADEEIKLPLSGWFPFETKESPAFEFAYIYLVTGPMIIGWANTGMDTLVCGLILMIFGQLRTLNYAFQIIGNQSDNITTLTEEIVDEMRKRLVENVIHHRNILQLADEISFLFSFYILYQVVGGVIVVCIALFRMSLVPILCVQFFSMILYQICVLLEVYLWCYYGNEVILESEKLTESAYNCQWIASSKEFKQDLLYFMTRSQIPLKLYGGGYFTLSIETFKAILKSSWSYFAVLNRVHSTES